MCEFLSLDKMYLFSFVPSLLSGTSDGYPLKLRGRCPAGVDMECGGEVNSPSLPPLDPVLRVRWLG